MKRKGVVLDVGVIFWMNWRPKFDAAVVRRELEIIRDDLHCTAVRIVGHSISRLTVAVEAALSLGLEVWASPQLWDQPVGPYAKYLGHAAEALEPLRDRYPDRLVLVVASEATLFARGILPGRTFHQRLKNPGMMQMVRAGEHRPALQRFLDLSAATARHAFHGPISYAALAWEGVDWAPFDFVGVDHYWSPKIQDRYASLLQPAFETKKPVVITEFGFDTLDRQALSDGFLSSAGLKPSVIDERSQFLHTLPLIGRLVRPRLASPQIRNEALQARQLLTQLELLDRLGVDGAFVAGFESQIFPYSPDPRFDLDMASSSLVKYFEHGHGATYPEMPWEPKESFRAVAQYYASR